jgi:hypothetical protein
VKNFLNERGVTGGGLLGFRRAPASDTMDGGEDGISWEESMCTGSDCKCPSIVAREDKLQLLCQSKSNRN